ncbi:amino acid ABC transporter substrate-binding component [Lentilactobacillus senioris DSM 24302 = JCM 17472]|uniref:Amino acid ABC transporter substrate-binding component n=1 Tax=Lentilactobacillus senioris DSM 24302 = JCM 17472 TaxID=1423802 RepID=A0A0R2CQU0_9LACO|nr:transporter substrate-binding domain-containing protein [Lentilactobacillus senioris]KRM94157.1 amino acid ABC transporter substrate-binding component [Lentilactobacillus senioris DSM 24302 = JCM 17472]MCY9805934.1 transporter substrate-binding domain-containing protein [Lentilactobacillus senioris]
MKKSNLKKLTALITATLAIVLVLAGCGKKQSADSELVTPKTLTVGLEGTYAPYAYRQNGKLQGFEVELGQQMAKKMGLKAKFIPTKWDSLIAGLGAKKFDVVLNNITVTPERKKQFIFSTPYIYSKSALILPKNSKITSVDQIKGKTFPEGTGTENSIQAKKFGANVIPSETFQNTVALISQGRAQGTINSREAFLSWAKDNPKNNLKTMNISTDKIAASEIAAMFNKNSPKLRTKANKALKELRADGTLARLSKKYFTADITQK